MNRQKRKKRTRVKLGQRSDRLRLSVFRSNKFIDSQIIDDRTGRTLVAASEKELSKKDQGGSKVDRAKAVGLLLAEKAVKTKLKKVVFDRGPYRYHGRVKALAEGARKGGVEF